MLKSDDYSKYQKLQTSSDSEYSIKELDKIELRVYSNKGELLIDPDFSLRKEINGNNNNSDRNSSQSIFYNVLKNGFIKFPMIDSFNISGLTINSAEKHLNEKYNQFYSGSYSRIKVLNRRAIVISGQGGTIVPLYNENMNLLEVLANSSALSGDFKAHDIRVIRGDLNNPQVEVINLSTIEGMAKSNLIIEPNDIIYIEPVQYVWRDGIKDTFPVISLITSLTSMILFFASLNQK